MQFNTMGSKPGCYKNDAYINTHVGFPFVKMQWKHEGLDTATWELEGFHAIGTPIFSTILQSTEGGANVVIVKFL